MRLMFVSPVEFIWMWVWVWMLLTLAASYIGFLAGR